MSLSVAVALRWMEVLIALGVLQGTLEMFAIRAAYADDGIWRWATLVKDLGWFRVLLGYRTFLFVLAVRLLAALLLLAGVRGAVAPVLWITTLLVSVRFLGTFNGGSDSMTMVVLSALVVAHLGAAWPLAERGALVYVAVQSIMSYCIAGLVKLANGEWRRGRALRSFVENPQFAVPGVFVRLFQSATLSRAASWLVIAFECAFPVVLAGPSIAAVLVFCAAAFQLGNVALFGLNRFVLAWAATWPAVLYLAG